MKKKLLLAMLALVLVVGMGWGIKTLVYEIFSNPNRYVASSIEETLPLEAVLTKKEALGDLDYFMKCFEGIHPAFIEPGYPYTEDARHQYQMERSAITGDTNVLALWQATSRIAASIHTGHCPVYPSYDTLRIISDERIKAYPIVSVNGISYETLYETYLTTFPYDEGMAFYPEHYFISYLSQEDYAQRMGLDTSSGLSIDLKTESGIETITCTYEESDLDNKNSRSIPYFYEIDKEASIGIFTLKKCQYDIDYQETVANFFREVAIKDIQHMIIDLRGNGGGNSMVALEFLQYVQVDHFIMSGGRDMRYGNRLVHEGPWEIEQEVSEDAYSGDIYVLMDIETYSAAMDFAVAIGDNHLGILIGEPSGNKPACYTDVKIHQMPQSKLAFYVPWKKIYRPDPSLNDMALIPDVEVPSNEAMITAIEMIEKTP